MTEQEKHVIDELTFEQAMKRLEEIVSLLEKGEATLDEMLALYEEGSALMRRCNGLLGQAKRRVEMVQGDEIRAFGGEDA